MPVLERLKREIPKHCKGVRVDNFYTLTKKFITEIEEARSLGYSWGQVCKAIEAECQAQGVWNDGWSSYDIESNYRRIKRETP